MKKQSAIILWCLLAILSGCTTAQFDKHHSSDSSPEPKLSLDEAKAAFEETYSIALTETGSGNGHQNKLSPGEFTPLWDNAAYSENPKACSYDVKLITERKVYALVAEFRNGKIRRRESSGSPETRHYKERKLSAHVLLHPVPNSRLRLRRRGQDGGAVQMLLRQGAFLRTRRLFCAWFQCYTQNRQIPQRDSTGWCLHSCRKRLAGKPARKSRVHAERHNPHKQTCRHDKVFR